MAKGPKRKALKKSIRDTRESPRELAPIERAAVSYPTAAELGAIPEWKAFLQSALRGILQPVALAGAVGLAAAGCGEPAAASAPSVVFQPIPNGITLQPVQQPVTPTQQQTQTFVTMTPISTGTGTSTEPRPLPENGNIGNPRPRPRPRPNHPLPHPIAMPGGIRAIPPQPPQPRPPQPNANPHPNPPQLRGDIAIVTPVPDPVPLGGAPMPVNFGSGS